MLVKDLKELKSFIKWAKAQKITRIKLGEIELDILPLSYVDNSVLGEPESHIEETVLPEPESSKIQTEAEKSKPVPAGASKTWVDTMKQYMDEEDKDLFWSAK